MPAMTQNGAVGWILALVPVAYLLGTFPSASLVARQHGVDVTKEGSGNPGASNVVRLLGWKAGALVLVLDAAKGAIAAAAGLAIDGHQGAWILGVAAVLGHIFPVWSKFKGGRGVATGAGVFLVVYPGVTLVLALVWILIARGLHKASVASLTVAVLAPIVVIVRGGAAIDIVVVCRGVRAAGPAPRVEPAPALPRRGARPRLGRGRRDGVTGALR